MPPPPGTLPGTAPVASGWGGTPPPPSGPSLGTANPGVGDVIEMMFRLYRETFAPTAAVLGVLLLPGLVLAAVAVLQLSEFGAVFSDPAAIEQFSEAQLQQILANPLLWLAGGLAVLLLILGQAAVVPAVMKVGADHLGPGEPSVGSALGTGFKRLWGIVGVFIAMFLLVMIVLLLPLPLLLVDGTFGFLFLLTVPFGIFAYFVVMMMGYLVAGAVVVEDIGAVRAFGRIRSLLRGTFWPTFGRGMLVGFLVQIIGWVLSAAGQFAGVFGLEVALVILAVVTILSYLVSTPLGVFGGLALYGDLRIRSEGTDVLNAAGRLDR